jgi:hypothetical protein
MLNPVLRGWAAYFKLTETTRALEEMDGCGANCAASCGGMETPLRSGTQLDEVRLDGRAGVALGVQSARPLVECRGEPHARSLPEILV